MMCITRCKSIRQFGSTKSLNKEEEDKNSLIEKTLRVNGGKEKRHDGKRTIEIGVI